ncbi:MAG TPA: hypothetical protein IGR64_10195 [Leptolyngbyaceae cyanobacterium M65_K2018_010]|nr:hypothetical protein [Leptolyngbyaceae cyanobacterium M65_K2018_010]
MNFKLISGLATSVVTAALLATAATPTSACMHNKAVTSGITTGLDNPVGFSGDTPDFQALAKAVGSFAAMSTLLAGGTMLYRRRQLAKLSQADAAAILAETDLTFTTQTESVVVSDDLLMNREPAAAQSEVKISSAR